jgi:hypothetical protein
MDYVLYWIVIATLSRQVLTYIIFSCHFSLFGTHFHHNSPLSLL